MQKYQVKKTTVEEINIKAETLKEALQKLEVEPHEWYTISQNISVDADLPSPVLSKDL